MPSAARVYYNEHDPFAVAWLRELLKAGDLPDGDIDHRSIADVQPADLRGFTQCHFFAGLGGWAHALDLARWGSRPLWTGSCPCQPFSAAGKGAAGGDPRHLWPEWFRLIRECRPALLVGEQVASAVGHGWWDLVAVDLEGEDYACAAAVLPSASVQAPHLRQRLWFVAHAAGQRSLREHTLLLRAQGRREPADCVETPRGGEVGGRMADADERPRGQRRPDAARSDPGSGADPGGGSGGDGLPRPLGHPRPSRLSIRIRDRRLQREALGTPPRQAAQRGSDARRPAHADGRHPLDADLQRHDRHGFGAEDARVNFWASAEWLLCRDGKLRPVEPRIFPLVDGVSPKLVPGSDPRAAIDPNTSTEARVGRLRGYGNAIVPQVAVAFLHTVVEICPP